MEIICPECHFGREVDETKIPARSQVATCPKCQTRFKFRELPEDTAEKTEQATPEQNESVRPTATLSSPKDKQAQPAATERKDESQTKDTGFPDIKGPGEDSGEGLWDTLDKMTPPLGKTQRKPPVIGAKYNPEAKPSEDIPKAQPASNETHNPIPGWTGEFSDDFPDPMQDEKVDEDEIVGPSVPPPFEQLDRYGFFHGIYMTIKLVLLSPRLFFSVMPVGGGLAKPLTFTILLSLVQGFIQYFWGLTGLSSSVTPQDGVAGVSGAVAPILMLLFMPAFIAAGQFLITGIYHVLLTLMRADDQGFEGTFRALTYANTPIILGIFPMPTPMIEFLWMAIAAVWGLALTIIGLKYIHKTSYAKVIPVCIIPLLLGMIAGLIIFQGAVPTI